MITIFEHEHINTNLLTVNDIVYLNKHHSKHLNIKQFSANEVELKANSYVGKIILPSGNEIIIKPKIKIINLLYIISYTFDLINLNYFEKKQLTENDSLIEIYVVVLLNWIENLFLKGLYKNYETHKNGLSAIKGKICMHDSISNRNKIVCEYDEISFSTIENKIMKATLHHIVSHTQINYSTRQRALLFYRLLKEISLIHLTKSSFKNISMHRLNNHYKPIIELCELIFNNLRLDDNVGDTFFSSYIFNMNIVYENFLLKVLQRKLKGETVKKSSKNEWTDYASDNYLPQIQPDIFVKNKAIIDAKYYKTPFTSKGNYISSHIYQLITYLKAYKIQNGYLIYPEPENGQIVDSKYTIDNTNFNLISIPLNKEICDIENAIDRIANEILTIKQLIN